VDYGDDVSGSPIEERFHVSVFFASEIGQLSYYDTSIRRSVYTYFFVKAANKTVVNSPKVTLRDMAAYVESEVPHYVSRFLTPNGSTYDNVLRATDLSADPENPEARFQQPRSYTIGETVFRTFSQ
jgi:hypothetical protein